MFSQRLVFHRALYHKYNVKSNKIHIHVKQKQIVFFIHFKIISNTIPKCTSYIKGIPNILICDPPIYPFHDLDVSVLKNYFH